MLEWLSEQLVKLIVVSCVSWYRAGARGCASLSLFFSTMLNSARPCGADANELAAPLCKHFASKGVCKYGQSCRFRHEDGRGVAEVEALRARRPCGRLVTRNAGKNAVLRRFIHEVFLSKVFSEGRQPPSLRAIDVAGGKGELAFELLLLSHFVDEVLIVDPRPLDLRKCWRRIGMGFYGRSEWEWDCREKQERARAVSGTLSRPEGVAVENSSHINSLSVAARLERSHLRCLLRPELFAEIEEEKALFPDEDTASASTRPGRGTSEADSDEAPPSEDDEVEDLVVCSPCSAASQRQEHGIINEASSMSRKSALPTLSRAEAERCWRENLRLSDAWDWKRHDRAHEAAAETRGPDDVDPQLDGSGQPPEHVGKNVVCTENNGSEVLVELEGTRSSAATANSGGPRRAVLDDCRMRLKSADLLVAMHPDQAAEAAVDLALRFDIPFFVVPCCVYAKEFPRRKIAMRQVTSYYDLLDYLQAKDPRIRRDVLPGCEGKNIVLWKV